MQIPRPVQCLPTTHAWKGQWLILYKWQHVILAYIIYPNISTCIQHLQLALENRLHPLLNSIEVLARSNVVALALLAHSQSKILCHDSLVVNNVNTCLLKALSELDDLWGAVELTTLGQTTGPGEDGGDWVGGGWVALLVLAEMASDGTVGSLSFESLSVWGDKDGGHKTERAETLGDDVGLNVTIVV